MYGFCSGVGLYCSTVCSAAIATLAARFLLTIIDMHPHEISNDSRIPIQRVMIIAISAHLFNRINKNFHLRSADIQFCIHSLLIQYGSGAAVIFFRQNLLEVLHVGRWAEQVIIANGILLEN